MFRKKEYVEVPRELDYEELRSYLCELDQDDFNSIVKEARIIRKYSKRIADAQNTAEKEVESLTAQMNKEIEELYPTVEEIEEPQKLEYEQ